MSLFNIVVVNDDDNESMKIKAAIVIGIGLTAIIVGFISFFMFRAYVQQGRYQSHRRLRKIHEVVYNIVLLLALYTIIQLIG